MKPLTGTKDADLEIMKVLDDNSLLNFCLAGQDNSYVRHLCSNETFWRNRFLEKFGNHYKSQSRSWKDFYLKVLKYSDSSLENIFRDLKIGSRPKGVGWGFIPVDDNGFKTMKNIDIIRFFTEKLFPGYPLFKGVGFPSREDREFESVMNLGMEFALEALNKEMMQFFMESGVINVNNAMIIAARTGIPWLVDFFIERGADAWEEGYEEARRNKDRKMMEFFRNQMTVEEQEARGYAIPASYGPCDDFAPRLRGPRSKYTKFIEPYVFINNVCHCWVTPTPKRRGYYRRCV